MCLILLSLAVHPDYPLILAANRDEYYRRPSAPVHYWEDVPDLLAGRDLQAGGTWLGLRRDGRWAALTNFREPAAPPAAGASRGHLVLDFLNGRAPVEDFSVDRDYTGFNLLVGQGARVYYHSNRGPGGRVEPGVHGLSNALLDTPWPKVVRGRQKLAGLASDDLVEGLLELLRDDTVAPDEQLPGTGVGLDRERLLSPMFIGGADYGTRCSTVLLLHRSGSWTFVERSYLEGRPSVWEDSRFQLG